MTTSFLFVLGFVFLIAGAEFLVRGASRLAIAAGISPLVVGLTVVAFGTSSPELAVTVQSAYLGQTEVAIGNVVGSNIANILLVLGLSAAVGALVVAQKLVRVEVPLMVGLSFLVLFMGLDGTIGWQEGILLTFGALVYTAFLIRQSRKENKEIRDEYAHEFDGHVGQPTGFRQVVVQLGLIIVGVVMLIFGSRWLVDGAATLARLFGVSELVIGLTVVAVGTSLPEIATSVVAAIRGERDIAVGNVIGSNIFNILLVLGVGGLVAADGLLVTPVALRFDIPLMIVVAIACLPIFFTDYRIDRWEGFLFLGYYGAYTIFLYLRATQHAALPAFSTIMAVFVLPLTVVTILIVVIRNVQTGRQRVVTKGSSPT